jgi:hypothetical protein
MLPQTEVGYLVLLNAPPRSDLLGRRFLGSLLLRAFRSIERRLLTGIGRRLLESYAATVWSEKRINGRPCSRVLRGLLSMWVVSM